MPRNRGPRGKGSGSADKPNGGGGGKRAAPYESRQGRKGGNQPATKGGDAGGRKNGGGGARGKGGNGGGGGGGRGRGGRGGGRGGRGDKPKPKTAEDLDREMDSYWGKSEEHAQKKLDSDMDDYWKTKDAPKEGEDDAAAAEETGAVEDKIGEPAAAAAVAEAATAE